MKIIGIIGGGQLGFMLIEYGIMKILKSCCFELQILVLDENPECSCSSLASKYNNLFGIKAYGDQKKVTLETKEFVNEEWITIQGDFKVYDSWEQSMDDHTQLFVQGVDWNPALYEKVITATNYQEAAQALQEAGYATDPGYAQKIIQVIETYQLNQYDRR